MRVFLIFCIVSLLVFPVFADMGGFFGSRGIGDPPPSPRLLYPVTENVNLKGQDILEFKWMTSDYSLTDHYEFKLYKGYKTVSVNLLMKEEVGNNENSFQVKADVLEDGQVYTWTLKRITWSGEKSDSSFNSFRVSK